MTNKKNFNLLTVLSIVTGVKLVEDNFFQEMAKVLGWLLLTKKEQDEGVKETPIIIPLGLTFAAKKVKQELTTQLENKAISINLPSEILMKEYKEKTIELNRSPK